MVEKGEACWWAVSVCEGEREEGSDARRLLPKSVSGPERSERPITKIASLFA